MLTTFQKYLSVLEPGFIKKRFLLAVSGGLDSVVMMELFRLSGCYCSIAHCNFQLRGKESDDDESFVKEMAAKWKVTYFSMQFDTIKFCADNKLSVQMGARQLRYEWLEEIRKKNKLDYIVTAHHADDAIETFFINLLRGTGISGLHGINARYQSTIRPMLKFYRSDIKKFALKNKLKWREDSSNGTDKYERNKIRHHLIPSLQDLNPKAKEAITATIENLGRAEILMEDSVNRITGKYINIQGDRILINFDLLKYLDRNVDYLYETIKEWNFNYEQCLQIVENTRKQPGKVFLSNTHRLIIDRDNFIIEPQIPGNEENTFEISTELRELYTRKCNYMFRIIENSPGFKIPAEREKVALDFDKLTFPLILRKWEKGDRFYPLGMNKPKKVSDFLIDNKISIPDKDHAYVLISGGDIAWLTGCRLDERFKITKGTKKIYLCTSQNAIIS